MKLIVAGMLAAGCWGTALAAQQPPAVLTLDEALALAGARNPAYRRAIAQADASGAGVRAGFGAFLPSLSAGLSWSGNSSTKVTGEDDFGRPVELPDPLTFRSSSASQSVSTSVTLFDGFRNLHEYRAARASAWASEARMDAQAVTVEAEVSRRFYAALQAQQSVGVEEELLAVSRQQLDATDRLFRVAARTEVDVLGAQIQVAQQEQALEQARGDARATLLLLAEAIGLEPDIAFRVDGALPAAVDPTALDADSLVAVALAGSPRVMAANAAASEAGYNARAAKSGRWPTISASAAFSRRTSLSSYDALFAFNPRDRAFGFGFEVRVPLFTQFQTSNTVAQAVAQERVADETLRETILEVERGVRTAHINLVTAFRRLQLAERQGELSQRRLTMAQQQYQLGTISFTEFQQVVTQTSQDARQLINAELEHARARVALDELLGLSGVGR